MHKEKEQTLLGLPFAHRNRRGLNGPLGRGPCNGRNKLLDFADWPTVWALLVVRLGSKFMACRGLVWCLDIGLKLGLGPNDQWIKKKSKR